SACKPKTPATSSEVTLRIGARGAHEAPTVIRQFLFAEGLFALDWHGQTTGRIATTFDWEPDGLTLHVPIRHGVTFHDGTVASASTVLRILQQKIKKSNAVGFEAVKKIEVGPGESLAFHLSRPDGFLPSVLASTLIVDDGKPDIGTGPFQLIAGP